ncbi:MAG: hypothetical protein PVH41_06130 [Anaerolineae bacterium]|jgi:hypothetical protein
MDLRRTVTSVAMLVLLAIVAVGGSAMARSSATFRVAAPDTHIVGDTAPLLQYQGRLTDPGTGEPVSDGSYTVVFRIYDVESGGSALWTETKDVYVQGGVFSTPLGASTALDPGLFNGQALWLGIKVEADAEASPRQPMLAVAYALGLLPGAEMSTSSSSAAFSVANEGAGDALRVDGAATVDGDLSVSGSLSGASHAHDGDDITSGTVAEARIDASIARDSEIMPSVLSNDGPGSGLNADQLDGQHGSAFAGSSHDHDGSDIATGTVAEARIDASIARDSEIMPTVLSNDGSASGLDADKLDGQHASAFAGSAHNHWGESWSGSGVGLTLSSSNTDAIVINSPGDDGIDINSADGDGLRVDGAGLNGVEIWDTTYDGVQVSSAGRFGLQIGSSGDDGIYIGSPGDDGVYIYQATQNGIRIQQAGLNGLEVWDATYDGVQVNSAGRYGVQANTDGTYGFYTQDKIFAGAGYDDIAEHIDATGEVEPGDVVVIDPLHDERVVRSTRPYDPAVAGIISTDPAMLIGDSETTTPLALAGRVPCKVSAENGPIHRGDLLTTSSTPGHAMKATDPTPGTVLGKAMGELASGTGVIPVLVTLQ